MRIEAKKRRPKTTAIKICRLRQVTKFETYTFFFTALYSSFSMPQ
jgi:hypothetical protein